MKFDLASPCLLKGFGPDQIAWVFDGDVPSCLYDPKSDPIGLFCWSSDVTLGIDLLPMSRLQSIPTKDILSTLKGHGLRPL